MSTPWWPGMKSTQQQQAALCVSFIGNSVVLGRKSEAASSLKFGQVRTSEAKVRSAGADLRSTGLALFPSHCQVVYEPDLVRLR
jgi:hypothetical protein